MSNQFVAEVRIFAGNFAPTGWATCDNQLLPLSQNTALFSLLGTTYGGDGKSTFALPGLDGCVPVQQGQGNGLQLWDLGQQQGEDFVTLLQSEMPVHTHFMEARPNIAAGTNVATANVPSLGAWVSGTQTGVIQQYTVNAPNSQMAATALTVQGGSLPHNNLMPYLTLTYIIALQGIFPPRP
jgi:microcystin-dependent protein